MYIAGEAHLHNTSAIADRLERTETREVTGVPMYSIIRRLFLLFLLLLLDIVFFHVLAVSSRQISTNFLIGKVKVTCHFRSHKTTQKLYLESRKMVKDERLEK